MKTFRQLTRTEKQGLAWNFRESLKDLSTKVFPLAWRSAFGFPMRILFPPTSKPALIIRCAWILHSSCIRERTLSRYSDHPCRWPLFLPLLRRSPFSRPFFRAIYPAMHTPYAPRQGQGPMRVETACQLGGLLLISGPQKALFERHAPAHNQRRAKKTVGILPLHQYRWWWIFFNDPNGKPCLFNWEVSFQSGCLAPRETTNSYDTCRSWLTIP